MRKLAMVGLCWLLCSGLIAAPAAVYRADFEGKGEGAPPGWQFAAQRGECAGAWDAAEPAGGRSLRLRIREDAAARATWTCAEKIPLRPSTAYRLSARVLYATKGAGARAYLIAYENGVEAPDHWHVTPFLQGACDWRTYTITFRTRADCEWLRLQCKLWHGTGAAWFDDILLEALPDDAEPAPAGQRQPPRDDGSPLQLMWYPAQRRPDETLCLVPGLLNPVAFFPWGHAAAVKEPHLILETPAQVRVRGEVVAGRGPLPPTASIQPEMVEREGKRWARWRIAIPPGPLLKSIKRDGPFWTCYHFLYAEPLPGCPAEFPWRWRLESGGQAGPEHAIPARLVVRGQGAPAPIAGFPLYAQHSCGLLLPTAEGRRRVLETLAYAGIHGGLSLAHFQPEHAALDEELKAAGYLTWSWKFDGYAGAGADARPAVTDGKARAGLVCPQAQVERFAPWWEDLCAYYRGRLAGGLKMLIIDYEPPTASVCFCPECRKVFAGRAGLDAARVAQMAPAEIRALPEHAWGRFRAWQNGQIVKHHIAAIHREDPKVRVGLCCAPYSPEVAQDGMDIRLFEPEVAFHAPMIYTVGTAYEGLVRSTCEGTRAPVLPFLLVSDMAVPAVFPLPADVRTNLLATALSGGRGAILWVGIESLDGEYLNALRDGLEQIRVLQPYLAGGTRFDLGLTPRQGRVRTLVVDGETLSIPAEPEPAGLRGWGWRSAKGTLAGVINYDAENTHAFVVRGAGAARSLFGPAPTRQGADALLRLAPGEAAALAW